MRALEAACPTARRHHVCTAHGLYSTRRTSPSSFCSQQSAALTGQGRAEGVVHRVAHRSAGYHLAAAVHEPRTSPPSRHRPPADTVSPLSIEHSSYRPTPALPLPSSTRQRQAGRTHGGWCKPQHHGLLDGLQRKREVCVDRSAPQTSIHEKTTASRASSLIGRGTL